MVKSDGCGNLLRYMGRQAFAGNKSLLSGDAVPAIPALWRLHRNKKSPADFSAGLAARNIGDVQNL